MNYTLHQLRLFVKIAETKSITRTSEELFLTQPAVSIQLRNFQNQFDIPLTEIIGRQLFVTEFGSEIAILAKKILEEVDEIQYKTLAFKDILAGKLKISVVSTGKYVMPFFLTDFLKKYHNPPLSRKPPPPPPGSMWHCKYLLWTYCHNKTCFSYTS